MEQLKKDLTQYALFDLPEHKFKEKSLMLDDGLCNLYFRWSVVTEIGRSPDGVYVMIAADDFGAECEAEKFEHFVDYFWM